MAAVITLLTILPSELNWGVFLFPLQFSLCLSITEQRVDGVMSRKYIWWHTMVLVQYRRSDDDNYHDDGRSLSLNETRQRGNGARLETSRSI
uniref:Putative secreted protein n=1 Tax=Anopheles triannulatus TaxID=58253 RepID=A0A2M4B6K9_9DIPT